MPQPYNREELIKDFMTQHCFAGQRLDFLTGQEIKIICEHWLSKIDSILEDSLSTERQFILNILDGIDLADNEMGVQGGTKAIRFALQSRFLSPNNPKE